MRRSLPLIHTLTGAWIPWLLLLAVHGALGWDIFPAGWLSVLGYFGAGFLYTQFFEYIYHRFPMHQLRGERWQYIRDAHTEHHRAFPRSRFFVPPAGLRTPFLYMNGSTQTMAAMIVQRWWVYPVLFLLHYVPGILLFPAGTVSVFLLGTVVHYNMFELAHWFTHVHPNRVDSALRNIPVVGALWAFTVDFHRTHHAQPDTDFNFTPPFLGDLLGRTWLTRRWQDK